MEVDVKKILTILILISFAVAGLMARGGHGWHGGGGWRGGGHGWHGGGRGWGGLGWYGGRRGWGGLGLYGGYYGNYLLNPLYYLYPYYYNPYGFYRNTPNVVVIKG